MDNITRRQSGKFDSAKLEAAMSMIQEEPSGKEEDEDPGMTQEEAILCVHFPTGTLTGMYDEQAIHLQSGYLDDTEIEKCDVQVTASKAVHNDEEVWFAEINSQPYEIVDATKILGVSNEAKKKQEKENEQAKEIERLRQELVNMKMQVEEMCKLMGERKDLGRITAKTDNVPPDITKTSPKRDDRRTSSFFITDHSTQGAKVGMTNTTTAMQEALAFASNPMLQQLTALKKTQEKEQ